MIESHDSLVELMDVVTLGLLADGGPETSPDAFQKLEAIVPLRGRKFYGVYDMVSNSYRVCTKFQSGDQVFTGKLEPFTIPSGKYIYRKLLGEHGEMTSKLPEIFSRMISEYAVDKTRPWIEFYRRLDEFRIYLPIVNH